MKKLNWVAATFWTVYLMISCVGTAICTNDDGESVKEDKFVAPENETSTTASLNFTVEKEVAGVVDAVGNIAQGKNTMATLNVTAESEAKAFTVCVEDLEKHEDVGPERSAAPSEQNFDLDRTEGAQIPDNDDEAEKNVYDDGDGFSDDGDEFDDESDDEEERAKETDIEKETSRSKKAKAKIDEVLQSSSKSNETARSTKTKGKINKAMLLSSKSNTTKIVLLKRTGKAVVAFLRKHEVSIIVAVALLAFRKEIKHFLVNLFPKRLSTTTGGTKVSVTMALKILFLVLLMRRIFGALSSSDQAPYILQMLLLLLVLIQHGGGDGVNVFPNPAMLALLIRLFFLGQATESSIYLPPLEQHYTFEAINSRYTKDGLALQRALQASLKPSTRSKANENILSYKALLVSSVAKQKGTEPKVYSGTTILLDMSQLDSSVSNIGTIRDKVSFILSQYKPETMLEVAVLLESPGGSAADYALAAQQLLRLRNHSSNITVTVLVDKVAASGGYMIACCSSPGRLYVAPFAVLGSIGVVGQAINIQKTLEGWGVQPLVFRGGRDKAPVGLLGEVTEEGLSKVQDMVDNTHLAFQRHVAEARPVLASTIKQVATGETWLGYDAVGMGLADGVMTSDEYISQRISQGALVLKLLRIKRTQSSFFRPPIEGADFGTSSGFLSVVVGVASRLLVGARTWANKSVQNQHPQMVDLTR